MKIIILGLLLVSSLFAELVIADHCKLKRSYYDKGALSTVKVHGSFDTSIPGCRNGEIYIELIDYEDNQKLVGKKWGIVENGIFNIYIKSDIYSEYEYYKGNTTPDDLRITYGALLEEDD